MFEEIKYYIQDNGKKVFMIFVIIALIILMFVLQNQNKQSSLDGQITAEEITTASKELQKNFSIISLQNVAYKDGKYALDIDLFLKTPHLSYNDMDMYINQYLDILKKQYNNKEKNKFIQAVNIRIYDRILIYEKDLEPRGRFEYKYTAKKVAEILGKDFEELDGIDYQREEALKNEKYPDYEKDYEIILQYAEYKDSTVTPLSTQELEFLLKMEVYKAFKESTQSYISAYFEWEYGVLLKDDQYLRTTLRDVFDAFQKRNTDTGGHLIYYDTEVRKNKLEKDLAINNPRFLYFILSGQHVEDKVEAKKGLMEYNKEKYLQIFIDDAIEKVRENSDDISSIKALEDLNIESDLWTNGDADVDLDSIEDVYENPNEPEEVIENEGSEELTENEGSKELTSTNNEKTETEDTTDVDAEINNMINNQ